MRKWLVILGFVFIGLNTFSQSIGYKVSFPNIAHHEANIQLLVIGAISDSLVFKMSRSSPGRYATHEFGKNVYNLKAFDSVGNSLPCIRTDADVYKIAGRHSFVKIEYTLYGNYADGTYCSFDASGVHINMPACFMWVKGLEDKFISLTLEGLDENWTIATQLKPAANNGNFTAPNLQYFMDCPIIAGPLQWQEWNVENSDGKNLKFRLALSAVATADQTTLFAQKLKKLVQEEQAVFGSFPNYDFGTYTFLASINPYVVSDGMEHRNSTMITLPQKFNPHEVPEVFAHEFFHSWNVERIRPQSLEPFNFEKSNMSDCLWFAEGFTQYYGYLLMKRAGFQNLTDFATEAGTWLDAKETKPGGRQHSPVEASQQAVFVDAGVAVDKTNYTNTYASYYPYGAAIALALDLELRTRFHLTLDSVMAAAWQQFGKTERPYTVDKLQQLLAMATGDSHFAHDFFTKYVHGHQSFNYAQLLAKAGFGVLPADSVSAWMGNLAILSDADLVIATNTILGTPLYVAGLDIGDKIVALEDKPMSSKKELGDFLAQHAPGDSLRIQFVHRNVPQTALLILAKNPRLKVVPYEELSLPITPAIAAFRKSWLETKLK